MPTSDITCDNCGSSFTLEYIEEEVSYAPTSCPFCADLFDSVNEELDFNDESDDYYDVFGKDEDDE